jgi:hypothetical protein
MLFGSSSRRSSTVRYQVLDPNFSKGNLGGNLITVIDGIPTVTMTEKQASYWLTQGAVLPLGAAGQLDYQLAGPNLVVAALGIDVPNFHRMINFPTAAPDLSVASPDIGTPLCLQVIRALGVDCAPLAIDTLALHQVCQLGGVGMEVTSPDFTKPPLCGMYYKVTAIGMATASPAIGAPAVRQFALCVATPLTVGSPDVGVTTAPTLTATAWAPPQLAGASAALFADFAGNNFVVNNSLYNTLASWLTALGGAYSRAGVASYLAGGIFNTAPANTPRYPTDLAGIPLGLRLTGPVTNLMPHSEYDSTAPFSASGATLTPNAAAAPNAAATMTAASFIPTAVNTTHNVAFSAGIGTQTSGNIYTYAIAVQPIGPNYYYAYIDPRNAYTEYTVFSFAGGVATVSLNVGGAVGFVIPLANGWFICGTTITNPITGNRTGSWNVCTATGGRTVLCDGVSGWNLWGQNYTQTNFLADYVPTATATATQAGDLLYWPTSPWLAASGTWAHSGSAALALVTQYVMGTDDNTGNFVAGASMLGRLGSGNNSIGFGGQSSLVNYAASTIISKYKYACIYDVPTTLQRVVDVNGGSSENNTFDYTGTGTVRFTYGNMRTLNPVSPLYGNVKTLAYWPQAATVAQAVSMLGTLQ